MTPITPHGMPEAAFDPFAGGAMVASGATTDAQREVLSAARLGDDANLAYNEGTLVSFAGSVDEARLINALEALYRRHDALRMTFSRDNEAFFVWDRDLVVERVPLGAAARAIDTARDFAAQPFDIDDGPLFRAVLLAAPPARHHETRLVLLAHHLVCDGWSLAVLTEELLSLYAHPDRPLAPAPGYADFAARERQATRTDSDAFWQQQFEGSVPRMELPATGARGVRRDVRSERIDCVIPQSIVDGMRTVAARNQTTLFSALLAAAAAMTSRLCGEDDVVLAVPSAGQSASGMDGLVGHCVNVLPVRCYVDAQETVDRFVRRVGSKMLDVREHHEYTIGRLLRTVSIPRVPGHVPVTPIMFNLDQGLQVDRLLQDTGVTATLHSIPRVSEYFEIFLNLVQHAGQPLVIECQYSASLFPAATIREWLEGYVALLQQMIDGGDQRTGNLLPIADATLDCMAHEWQGSTLSPPHPACIHDTIAAMAAATPEAIAVVDETSSLTYRELMSRRDALAARLRAHGAGSGTRLAISASRTCDLPVAMLAVLATGAAYVPLDPEYPVERLRHMLTDSAPVAWIVDGAIPDGLRDTSVPIVDLRVAPSTSTDGEALPSPSIDATTAPAYVIYTSGSTGRPKGVVVPHAAVTNFLMAMRHALPVSAADRVLALTTLSFDIAVLELLLPLSLGATTCLVDRDTARDPVALAAAVDRFGITVMQATPSTWRLLLDSVWTGRPSLLALSGGEPLPTDVATRLRASVGRLWNMFGPTETTVWSTVHEVGPTDVAIPIGRPIANTQVEIVDARDRRVPIGVPGELLIGGAGLALGYHERPDLTADRFVVHPLAGGARMYRTGDLAAWQADGRLQMLGRIDSQVKLRGFRIELGEIEAVLAESPAVAVAAARVWDDGAGDARIAAYVVPVRGATIAPAALLQQLAARVPAYMLPQHVVVLESLPRTPNGKLDRNALPEVRSSQSAEIESGAEWTTMERTVAEVWQEVLGRAVDRRSADFFALGGHSILVARAVGRLEKRLGVTIGMRALFEASRLDAFARAIPAADASGGWEELRI